MSGFKFNSFELFVEFDIGQTPYHIIWMSDNIKKENEVNESSEMESEKEKEETGNKEDDTNKFDYFPPMFNDTDDEKTIFEQDNMEKENNGEELNEDKNQEAFKYEDEELKQEEEIDEEKDLNGLKMSGFVADEDITEDDTDKKSIDNETPKFTLVVKQSIETKDEQVVTEEIAIPLSEASDSVAITIKIDLVKTDKNELIEEDKSEEVFKEENIFSAPMAPESTEEVRPADSIAESNDDDLYETVETSDNYVQQFSLELGAGQSSIRLSKTVTTPPLFSESTEKLDPGEMENFATAWIEAVSISLERRMMMSGSYSLEELLETLVRELGLTELGDLVNHFLGELSIEHAEHEENNEGDDKTYFS